jgi:hypothetical protein
VKINETFSLKIHYFFPIGSEHLLSQREQPFYPRFFTILLAQYQLQESLNKTVAHDSIEPLLTTLLVNKRKSTYAWMA